jgi:hypothetical protein
MSPALTYRYIVEHAVCFDRPVYDLIGTSWRSVPAGWAAAGTANTRAASDQTPRARLTLGRSQPIDEHRPVRGAQPGLGVLAGWVLASLLAGGLLLKLRDA